MTLVFFYCLQGCQWNLLTLRAGLLHYPDRLLFERTFMLLFLIDIWCCH